MGRKEERIKKQLEKNPIKECNKIQNKFYPELFKAFGETKDPRHASYIEYSNQVMLTSLYYKDICGISSMQEMTRKFNDDVVVKNIYGFINEEDKEYLPHSVTINEYLSKLNPKELGKIRDDIVKKMVRRKTFNDARILGKWLVIVDGTELDNTCVKKNDSYLERCYNKGTADEYKQEKSYIPWNSLYGLRNRIVHDYGNVDLKIVYETLKNDIPELLEMIEL